MAVPFVAAACGRPPYDPALFHRPSMSAVGLFPAADYAADFAEIVARGLRELGIDVRGRHVLLKPNMVEREHLREKVHSLIPQGESGGFIVRTVAETATEAELNADIEYLVTQTGLYDHLRENRIRFVDLNHDDVRYVPLRSRFTGLETIALSSELLQADFIVTMPKLKTHHWAGMTACMKNLFGTVPGAGYGWPKNILHMKGIENSILDLNATIRPNLAIVDAVTAMEGDGPSWAIRAMSASSPWGRMSSPWMHLRAGLRPRPGQIAVSRSGWKVPGKP